MFVYVGPCKYVRRPKRIHNLHGVELWASFIIEEVAAGLRQLEVINNETVWTLSYGISYSSVSQSCCCNCITTAPQSASWTCFESDPTNPRAIDVDARQLPRILNSLIKSAASFSTCSIRVPSLNSNHYNETS